MRSVVQLRRPNFLRIFTVKFQVDERCNSGEVRLSRTRDCVDPETVSCEKACPQSSGNLDVESGSCICRDDSSGECNSTCRATKPKITIQRNSTSSALYVITRSDNDVKVQELNDDYGIADYDHDVHDTEIVRVGASGITGVLITDTSQSPFENPSPRVRRAVTNATNTHPVLIHNPFMCIAIGTAILFEIEVNEMSRSLSHYPRYNKDHLFNVNDRFDYGNFRLLHSLIQDTNKSLSTFANVFTEAGVFVFYDNAEPSREMIVKVTAQGEQCSDDQSTSQLLHTSSSTLTEYGVAKSKVSGFFRYFGIFDTVTYLLFGNVNLPAKYTLSRSAR